MNPKTRRRFSAEFKTQAVQLLETGKPIAQVAEELSISSDLLYSWRRENSLLRQENDILKMAAEILGTKLLPSSAK
jgi:transposase-like protein